MKEGSSNGYRSKNSVLIILWGIIFYKEKNVCKRLIPKINVFIVYEYVDSFKCYS